MRQFGETRSVRLQDHLLQTPEAFVRSTFAGLSNAAAIVHASPALGATFAQYTVEFGVNGRLDPIDGVERFVYALEGEIYVDNRRLRPGGFAYLPQRHPGQIVSEQPARAVVIEKPYLWVANAPPPKFFLSQESQVESKPLQGDSVIETRALLPPELAFDFAVHTLTFQPGASLPSPEGPPQEQSHLLLSGGGLFRINDNWYPATAGDFLWIAPYCPRWFGSLGKAPTKYLLYRDCNRAPMIAPR